MKREAICLDTSSFYYYAYTLYKHMLHERSADIEHDTRYDESAHSGSEKPERKVTSTFTPKTCPV